MEANHLDAGAAAPQRSPAAERVHRYRERRSDNLRCCTIEVREAEITKLVQGGFLQEANRENPKHLTEAVHKLLDKVFWGRL